MPGRIQSTIEMFTLAPRAHAKIMKDVMEKTGTRHKKNRVEKRFERNRLTTPGGPLGFRKRSKKTIEIKRRLGLDPDRPNFRTGRMLAFVQNNSELTKTQYKWTWRAKAPFPLEDYRRDELEAIAPEEVDADTRFMAAEYTRLANKRSNLSKRTKKSG